VLIVETAGRDVRSVRILAENGAARVERTVTVHPDPTRFQLVELRLPPGRYRRIALEMEPTPGLSHIQRATGLSVLRAGRLYVRRVAAYPNPATTGAVGGAR
jgi:hypothetical protein